MTPFQHAVALAGGPSKLAAHLGVTPQAVCFWRDGARRLPVEHCAAVEQFTAGAVTRQQLRPNDWSRIWPELADTSANLQQKQPAAHGCIGCSATQSEAA